MATRTRASVKQASREQTVRQVSHGIPRAHVTAMSTIPIISLQSTYKHARVCWTSAEDPMDQYVAPNCMQRFPWLKG